MIRYMQQGDVMNFIFVSLCDNDYQYLLDATKFVFENREVDLTEEEFKFFVIEYVIGRMAIGRINPRLMRTTEDNEHTRKYLEKSIKVSYLDQVPDLDHDGGSVIMNVYTKQAWRI